MTGTCRAGRCSYTSGVRLLPFDKHIELVLVLVLGKVIVVGWS
jgi:hypothetical protein